jgi:YrbI family 3-deoxy-D-manno-octulosonate 8-phosphate phosphatase
MTIIQKLLEKNNLSESEFCSKFGVTHIEKLPLSKIHEIAAELGISVNQLIYGRALTKPFPEDIKLLILDVDGVMTDAGMYCSENGDILKKFNARDGMGILQLTKTGFQVGIISSGFKGELVKQRADLLKIQHFYLGREHKLEILKQWCNDLNITLNQVAMIGDDVNDLAVMQAIGYSACPSDAATAILKQADCILSRKGGEGCIREFIEDIMKIEVEYQP